MQRAKIYPFLMQRGNETRRLLKIARRIFGHGPQPVAQCPAGHRSIGDQMPLERRAIGLVEDFDRGDAARGQSLDVVYETLGVGDQHRRGPEAFAPEDLDDQSLRRAQNLLSVGVLLDDRAAGDKLPIGRQIKPLKSTSHGLPLRAPRWPERPGLPRPARGC
jgi:hypothetical protein